MVDRENKSQGIVLPLVSAALAVPVLLDWMIGLTTAVDVASSVFMACLLASLIIAVLSLVQVVSRGDRRLGPLLLSLFPFVVLVLTFLPSPVLFR